ncbi:MAG: hypothetical protein ABSA02_14480 [Trebonia sp.]|jgi:hypothetical protein
MPFLSRRTSSRLAWAAVAACAAALPSVAALSPVQAAVRGPAGPAAVTPAAAKAGLTHSPITVTDNAEFSGYDLATGPNGTAYLGWIGDTGAGRQVHLCTLPRGATRCAGGVQTIASAPDPTFTSTAAGLRVLVSKSNLVTLVWMHSTVASENGPEGDEIAIATSQAGGKLSAARDVSPGPSFGYFLDATLAPNGSVWAVTNPSTTAGSHTVQITKGLGTRYQSVKTPFWPGEALLAFNGASAVLAIDQDGTITRPVYFDRQSGSGWTAFKAIARTWDVEGFGLATTTSGVRLIASESNAGYHPVVSRLTTTGWTTPALTGDVSNCSPVGHDVVADASGRLADASEVCADAIAVENLADTRHAAIVRFGVPGTFAGGEPQLTTSPSGRGWVAWSVESPAGDKLLVAPLVLPGLRVTTSAAGAHGRVVVTGPATCLPPVDLPVSVAGKPASGWRVAGKSLKLGSSAVGAVLHGASLTAGLRYTLTGTVTFARGSARSTYRDLLGFRTCPRP